MCSTSSSSTILKRKRPARITIPIGSLSLEHAPREESGQMDEVEVEEEGYSVFCKRGKKRGDMEDRYSAVIDHAKDGSKQVFICKKCLFDSIVFLYLHFIILDLCRRILALSIDFILLSVR